MSKCVDSRLVPTIMGRERLADREDIVLLSILKKETLETEAREGKQSNVT